MIWNKNQSLINIIIFIIDIDLSYPLKITSSLLINFMEIQIEQRVKNNNEVMTIKNKEYDSVPEIISFIAKDTLSIGIHAVFISSVIPVIVPMITINITIICNGPMILCASLNVFA